MIENNFRPPSGLFGPLYVQVAEALISSIIENKWTSERPLPSEIDLAVEFGVSVGTMRKALEQLEKVGAIVRQRGRGTFVRANFYERSQNEFQLFYCEDGPVELVYETVSVESADANLEDARRLDIAVGKPVHKVERLIRDNSRVKARQEVLIPQDVAEVISDDDLRLDGALYDLYAVAKGLVVFRVEDRVWPVTCDEHLADRLSISVNQPLIVIDRHSFDPRNRVLDWRRTTAFLKDCEYGGTFSAQ
jgi:GntR family transcriptional regulator